MDQTCPSCGTVQDSGNGFCQVAGCGTYLGWNEAKGSPGNDAPGGGSEVVERQPTAQPVVTDAPREVTTGLAARASREEVSVEPGETATVDVVIRNTGSVVEHVDVSMSGDAADFSTVSPASVQIYPGNEKSVQVVFHPARSVQPRAGDHLYALSVRSRLNDVRKRLTGTVSVGAFCDVAAGLSPEETRGRRRSFVQSVLVTNRGNNALDVKISAEDPSNQLEWREADRLVSLAPGEEAAEPLKGQGRRKWFGAPEVLAFDVEIQPHDQLAGAEQTPRTLTGRRRQLALIPRWLPALGAALVAGVVALGFLLTGSESFAVPAVANLTSDEAASQLRDAGLKERLVPEPSDGVQAGLVTRTDPAAGTSVEEGTTVTVYISSGPAGKEPVVPTLLGMPEEEAMAALEAARLRGRTGPRVFSDEVARGGVVRTEPPAGTALSVDSVVSLVLSKGPQEDASSGGPTPTKGTAGTPSVDPEPELVEIPTLAGTAAEEAEARLEDLGLSNVATKQVQSNVVPPGQVISTRPEAGADVTTEAPVVLTVSAGGTPPLQLALQAGEARWSTGPGASGAVPIEFGRPTTDPEWEAGYAYPTTGPMEDGSEPVVAVHTHPRWVPHGWIRGDFTLPAPIIEGDTLTGSTGLEQDAGGAVLFVVLAVTADGSVVELGRFPETADGALTTLDLDLSDAAGARVLRLEVRAGESSGQDWAVWVDPVVRGS